MAKPAAAQSPKALGSHPQPPSAPHPSQPAGFWATKAGLIVGALLCNFLWGSAIPAVTQGYQLLSIEDSLGGQMLFAGVRFAASGIAILVFWTLLHRKTPQLTPTTLKDSFFLCLLWTVGQYACYYVGMAHATGVSASIIQGFEVFVTLILGALCFHSESLTPRKVAGSLIGVAGIALFSGGGTVGFSWMGEGLLAAGTVFASMASQLLAKYSKRADPIVLAGAQFVLGGLILAFLGTALGGQLALAAPAAWGILAWLILVSSVAYGLWSYLIATHPVSSVVVWSFTLPVFGVLLSLVLLGDQGNPFGLTSAVAVALLCLGIWLVDTDLPKKPAKSY